MDVLAQRATVRSSVALNNINTDRKSVIENAEETSLDTADPQSEGGPGAVGVKPAVGLTGFKKLPQGNFFDLLATAISAVKVEAGGIQNFHEYLQTSGIKMAWVRAIVALYEEPKKPDDPLAYILKLMGLGIPEITDVQLMQERIKFLRVKLLQVQSENEKLRELVRLDEEAQEQNVQTQELVSLFDESKYFSEYVSDDDTEYEGAAGGGGHRVSETDSKKHHHHHYGGTGHANSAHVPLH